MNCNDHQPSRRDEGVIAVMTAILAVVLFGLAALAVDVARWYMEAARIQRAVDAAATAGVPNLPEYPSSARTKAIELLNRNGYTGTPVSTATIQQVSGKPSQLYVSMTVNLPNTFGTVLGVTSASITRTATADYAADAAMGSPCNVLGNYPPDSSGYSADSALCPDVPNFWSVIAFPDTQKAQGDRYASRPCSGTTDGCTGTSNDDYFGSPLKGIEKKPYYAYKVKVTSPVSRLDIQLYDPMFVNVGQTCNENLPAASTWTTRPNPFVPSAVDASARYAPSRTEYCTGDTDYNQSSTITSTHFAVLAPTESRNPFESSILASPASISTCYQSYSAFDGNLSNALRSTNAAYNPTVARNFRQWVTLCTIVNPQVNRDYYVLARTNVTSQSEMLNLNINRGSGYAQNRYGIRADAGSGANSSVSVSAVERLPIFATIPGGTTEFYLARVLTANRGSDLDVTFFDTGDSSTAGAIQVLQPRETGSTLSWTTIPTCEALGEVRGSANSPSTLNNCILSPVWNQGSGTNYQGRIQRLRIKVPDNYACTDTNAAACWYKLQFTYPALDADGNPTDVTDTTTWSASLNGDPVRLIPNPTAP